MSLPHCASPGSWYPRVFGCFALGLVPPVAGPTMRLGTCLPGGVARAEDAL